MNTIRAGQVGGPPERVQGHQTLQATPILAERSPLVPSQQSLVERTSVALANLIAISEAPRHLEQTVIGLGGEEQTSLEVLQTKEEERADYAVLVNGIETNIKRSGFDTGEIEPCLSDDVVTIKYKHGEDGKIVVYVAEGTYGSTKTARLTITGPGSSHFLFTEVFNNLGGETDISQNGPYLDVTQDEYRVSGVQVDQKDNSMASALALLRFVPSTSSR